MANRVDEHRDSRIKTHAPEPTVSAGATDPAPWAQAELARLLGYASYLDLFESSKPASNTGQRHWLVTAKEGGRWVLWGDVEFKVVGEFDSQQAALSAAEVASLKKE